jgi:predicted NAD/FAD-binding protein
MEFPASAFIQFFKNHGLLSFTDHPQWYTVTGGSNQYLQRLIRSYQDQIHVNCSVESVEVIGDKVHVHTSNNSVEIYDEVVFACHGDEACGMLKNKTVSENQILGSFTYQKNIAYLHRDTSLMPKRRACWSSWIYSSKTQYDLTDVSVTYWMNNLQNIDPQKPVFVTLNPLVEINPNLVFDVHEFYHPVFDKKAIDAQKRIPEIQGKRHLWFCGAYQQYGFHEDGLASAVRMVQAMGGTVPWHKK